MGKGKGSLSYWCYPVKIGEIIFEFQGISQRIAEEVGRLGASKLPVQVRFVMIKQKN
jgi:large subunit ribosomal protein L16